MSGLAANRRPRIVAPRSPRIIFLGFYKGGRGARSDSKAADWNYDHWMFDLAVRDPGCPIYDPIYGPIYGPRYSPRYGSRHDPIYGQRYSPRYSPTIGQQKRNSTKQKITNDQNEKRIFYFNWDSSENSIQQQQLHLPGEFKVHHSQVFPQEDDLVQPSSFILVVELPDEAPAHHGWASRAH